MSGKLYWRYKKNGKWTWRAANIRGPCPTCKMWYDHEFDIACSCKEEEE